MNLTIVLVIAAVVVFLALPLNAAALSTVFAAAAWLLYEAHRRRGTGREFSPVFRALLWAAAVFAGLISLAAGALSVLVLMDKNAGWGGILLLFTVPICLVAAAGVFVYGWYARYQSTPDARAKSDESP